jgi:hypothetical protein
MHAPSTSRTPGVERHRTKGDADTGAAQFKSAAPANATDEERQILVRIDRGGAAICESELRYQLDTKDRHPIAHRADLLDLLAELEERGLIESALHFRLTAHGRAELPRHHDAPRRAGSASGVPWKVAP